MPRYDASRYDPPAPLAIVGLRRSGSDSLVRDVPLLIDTGADVTLLPRSAVARLGVTPDRGLPLAARDCRELRDRLVPLVDMRKRDRRR
jgi:hypothetical protein